MELLIPGLILVALMVYASTRIKKSAARAYEPETIETEEFVIQKPEEFLHNLNADPGSIFEAYSKGFSAEHPSFRLGTASIKKFDGQTVEAIATNKLANSKNTIDDDTEKLGERSYRILVIQRDEDGVEMEISYKITEVNASVYTLEVKAVPESANGQWVETFVDSFRVK